MTAKRLIWVIAALVAIGAAGFLAVELGGVTSSRLPGTVSGASAVASASAAAAASPSSTAATTAANGSAGATVSVSSTSAPVPAVRSTGGAKVASGSASKQASNPGSHEAPAKPKPSGPVLKDHISSASAVTFLAIKDFGAPQTYSAVIVPAGWNDLASGQLVARVVSASPSGPIDAATGQQMAPPTSGTPDHGKQLTGITVLAATNPVVRGDITNKQHYKVNIVLLPSAGAGAVFVIDRLR